jgi:Zn-dependent protease
MALSALAGPMANLILGIISALFYGFFWALGNYLLNSIGPDAFWFKFVDWTILLFTLGAFYNFFFMIFNLIPVPPFDGSRIALAFLPTNIYFRIMRYERQIMAGILIALLLLSRVASFSPFSWIAGEMTDLVFPPSYQLFNRIFLPDEIYRILFP